jgi:hypothetical protein
MRIRRISNQEYDESQYERPSGEWKYRKNEPKSRASDVREQPHDTSFKGHIRQMIEQKIQTNRERNAEISEAEHRGRLKYVEHAAARGEESGGSGFFSKSHGKEIMDILGGGGGGMAALEGKGGSGFNADRAMSALGMGGSSGHGRGGGFNGERAMAALGMGGSSGRGRRSGGGNWGDNAMAAIGMGGGSSPTPRKKRHKAPRVVHIHGRTYYR